MSGMEGWAERLQKFGKLMRGRLDKVLVGALGLIFVIVGLLYFAESRSEPGTPPDPKPVDPISTISTESTNYQVLQLLIERPASFETTIYKNLVDFNMFDPKASADNEAREKEAEKLVAQAQALVDQARYDQAREVLTRALKLRLAYKPALTLLDEIETLTKPESPATAPTAATAPK